MTRPREDREELTDALETTNVCPSRLDSSLRRVLILSSPQEDPFARLPTELLQMILDHNKDDVLPAAPISRPFLPFQYRDRFHNCQVHSVGAYHRLMAHLKSDDTLAKNIEIFEFRVEDHLSSVPLARLVSFLSTIPQLESLTLLDFPPAKTPIFPQSDLAHCLLDNRIELQNLKHLAFRIPSDWPTPFEPQLYRFLDRFPSLVSLDITYYSPRPYRQTPYNPLPLGQSVPNSFLRITSLAFEANQTVSAVDLAIFVSLFPNAKSFIARKTWWTDGSDFTTLLAFLPDTLTSLGLASKPATIEQVPECLPYAVPIDDFLHRFQNLESLTLGPRTFSDNILDSLKELPLLKHLVFPLESFPPLEAFREQADLPPSLETVEMSQIKAGKVGWRMDGPFSARHPTARILDLGPGWDLPGFKEHRPYFSYKSLKVTIETLRGFGITVKGSAVEAIDVQEEAIIQTKYGETANAVETGHFVGLKKKYGEEWTKAAKAERRRRKKAWDLIKKERAEARGAGNGRQGGGTKKKGGGKKSK